MGLPPSLTKPQLMAPPHQQPQREKPPAFKHKNSASDVESFCHCEVLIQPWCSEAISTLLR